MNLTDTSTQGPRPAHRAEVTPSDLAEWIFDGPTPTVFDLRDEPDYRAGHIPGALHTPIGRSDDLVAIAPDDGLIVLVCATGAASREAVRLLELCGHRRVAYLHGGQRAWVAAGYPVGA